METSSVILCDSLISMRKKYYIPPFVPSEQNTFSGGDIINLINSFFFSPLNTHPSDYAMGDDVTF